MSLKIKILLIISLFAVIFVDSFIKMPAYDTDTFWHLKAGELISKNKNFHFTDNYSCTAKGFPWRNYEWLSEIIFYITYIKGNFFALQILKSIIIMITFLFIFMAGYEFGKNLFVSWIITILACKASQHAFTIRPQIFSLLFFSIFLFLAVKFQNSFNTKKFLFIFPLIMLIWANFHGAYIIGLIYFLMLMVFYALKRDSVKAKSLFLIFILSFLAVFINPNTYHAITYSLYWIKDNPYTRTIVEFLPLRLDIHDSYFQFFLVFSILFILGVIIKNILGGKFEFLDFIFFFPLMYLPLKSNRHLSIFVLGISHLISGNFSYSSKISFKWKPLKFISHAGSVILFILSLIYLGNFVKINYPFNKFIMEETYPKDLIEFIKINKIQGNVFNDYGWGGYIIWRCGENLKVFIDGRVKLLYPEKNYLEYLKVVNAKKNWESILNKYNITLIILKKEFNFLEIFKKLTNNNLWELLYEDDLALLYIKKDVQNYKILEKLKEKKLIFPETYSFLLYEGVKLIKENKTNEAYKKLREANLLNPQSAQIHLFLGYIYSIKNKTDEALKEWKRALEFDSTIQSAHYNIGIYYKNKGMKIKAKEELKQELKINPDWQPALKSLKEL
ncbi:MAG: tetratricopeptide repeat protein [Armatimonadetes bacterium]|nr:tetratricopeptide repeat protein [Armatimonadota bacterium]